MGPVLAVLVCVGGLATLAVGLRGVVERRRAGVGAAYLQEVLGTEHDDGLPDDFADRLAQPFFERILRPVAERIVAAVGLITPSDHRARVRLHLAEAGLDVQHRPEDVIAAQGIGAALGLVAGVALASTGWLGLLGSIAVTLLLVAIGVIGPVTWLRRRVDARLDAIRRDLPETLDLLAISVEAGLGLEGAMERVVDGSTGPLASELDRTLREMELGLSRRDALVNLRTRAPVTELSTFVHTLVQADILGMPLVRVLRVQADDLRLKRRQWARERAAKLPVKILFPLVACIFPAIMVIVLGPALSQIGDAF